MDLEENASWDFTGNTIVKIEKGLVGTWREGVFSDVTSDSGLKLSTNFPCLPRETGKGRALEIDPRRFEAICLPTRKKDYQMNTFKRKYYIETEKNELWSIQGSDLYTQKKILHGNRKQ